MSATAHRYTCDQLGTCQSRVNPCPSCKPASSVSEGTRSARTLLEDTARPRMPQPYLLDTSATPARKPAPLRYLKPAPPPADSECGFGVCIVTPECTSRCRARAAEEALKGHVGTSQKQALPEVQPAGAMQGAAAPFWKAALLVLAVLWGLAAYAVYIA